MIIAAVAASAACSGQTDRPGGDIALEKRKLDDIRADPVARFTPNSGPPDESIPIVASPNTAASWSGVWSVPPDSGTADVARWMDDLRDRGVAWHDAVCRIQDSLLLGGTARLRSSVAGVPSWPADVSLSLFLDPEGGLGEVRGTYLQLSVTVERGKPGNVPRPSAEPTECPPEIATRLT